MACFLGVNEGAMAMKYPSDSPPCTARVAVPRRPALISCDWQGYMRQRFPPCWFSSANTTLTLSLLDIIANISRKYFAGIHMADNNAVGERGEAIFLLSLTELVGPGDTPYFRARQQGEKWPVTDFYCELDGKTGHCFMAQAKATRQPLVPGANLPISTVSEEKIAKLFMSPVPFYLVAIHEPTKQAYIGVPNTCRSISSVPTNYLLSSITTLNLLKKEVEDFWSRTNIVKFDPIKSKFSF